MYFTLIPSYPSPPPPSSPSSPLPSFLSSPFPLLLFSPLTPPTLPLLGGGRSNESAEEFFRRVQDTTGTLVLWPSRLKIGAKSKKGRFLLWKVLRSFRFLRYSKDFCVYPVCLLITCLWLPSALCGCFWPATICLYCLCLFASIYLPACPLASLFQLAPELPVLFFFVNCNCACSDAVHDLYTQAYIETISCICVAVICFIWLNLYNVCAMKYAILVWKGMHIEWYLRERIIMWPIAVIVDVYPNLPILTFYVRTLAPTYTLNLYCLCSECPLRE